MNIALIALLAATGAGSEAKLPDNRFIGRPDMAIRLAATDAEAVLREDPHAMPWYIWVRDSSDDELIDAYDYCLNTAFSRADVALRSTKIDGGTAGTLLRVDLLEWLPDVQHRFNFLRIIEEYEDPSFYLDSGETHRVTIQCAPYTLKGKEFTSVSFPNMKKLEFAPVLAGAHAAKLQQLTGLAVPIVEAEKWMVDSLRTLEGGIYYQLQGYDGFVGTQRKRLNQKEWLAQFGADEEESARLNGEEFVGMWRSGVLGKKPRRAKFMYGRAVRPSVAPPLIVISQDTLNDSLNTDQHAIYSLLDFRYDATEILATRSSGAIAYAIFNGEGELQDAGPGNLVADHEVPEPHTNELEPAISCMRCHADSNQWKPMPNQVKTLLSTTVDGQRVIPIADFSHPNLTAEEFEHKLRLLYSGDLTRPLKIARDAHEYATIEMVDFRLQGDGYAKEAMRRITERFNKYVYDPIDPQEALRTLGIACSKQNADRIFQRLFPVDGLVDPAIATLRLHAKDESMVVNRSDWERIYQPALSHAFTYGVFKHEPVSTDAE